MNIVSVCTHTHGCYMMVTETSKTTNLKASFFYCYYLYSCSNVISFLHKAIVCKPGIKQKIVMHG